MSCLRYHFAAVGIWSVMTCSLVSGQGFAEFTAIPYGGIGGADSILPYPSANWLNSSGLSFGGQQNQLYVNTIDRTSYAATANAAGGGVNIQPTSTDGPVFNNILADLWPSLHTNVGSGSNLVPGGATIPSSSSDLPVFHNVLGSRPAVRMPSSSSGRRPNGLIGRGGRLVDPPNRSSLWREGVVGAPVNVLDNQVNCGYQWMPLMLEEDLELQCGVCGDFVFGTQHHLMGGRYVSYPPYVSRDYTRVISVTFLLNQTVTPGFDTVTFAICPVTGRYTDVTWGCLENQESALQIEGWGKIYYPTNSGYHSLTLRVSETFSCKHCVLQWRWQSSQMADSQKCRQEPFLRACYHPVEYINCADIRITAPPPRRSNRNNGYPLI